MINHSCSNLYYLSTIACQMAECMEEKELEIFSADLKILGEMLESLLIRKSRGQKE